MKGGEGYAGGPDPRPRSLWSRSGSSSHRNVKPELATSFREIVRVPGTWPLLRVCPSLPTVPTWVPCLRHRMCRSPHIQATFVQLCQPTHGSFLSVRSESGGSGDGEPRKPCHLWGYFPEARGRKPRGTARGLGGCGCLGWASPPGPEASWVECSLLWGCPVHPSRCPLEAKHTHPTCDNQRCL